MSGSTIRLVASTLILVVTGSYAVQAEDSGTVPQGTIRAQYPQLNAPMYPVPQPNIPAGVGGAAYTNQALAPHEMLHEHEYRAMYPPYYYKVNGVWWWTPFGMESHDRWKLQGTFVNVKYHSQFGPIQKVTSRSRIPNYLGATRQFAQSLLVETGEIFR